MAAIVDIYRRVSTDQQEDNTSLDEQEAAGRDYCKEHGLVVGMVHREVGSGYQYREREKLSQMRERYLSGQIQGVVVRTFDRLSRKEVHFGILLEEMEHKGIQLHCVKEVLEDSIIGRLTRMFLGFLAEWEWEKIYERTTTGRINAAKQGKIVAGRKLPYGWKWQVNEKGEKVCVVHDNHQLWVIRWMALQYVRGTSTLGIAKRLNDRHEPSPEGGQQWHTITIRRILLNERLTGKARIFAYQTEKAKKPLDPIELPEGTYPPIISEELFTRIQVRLQRNKDESSRSSERPEDFLLRAGFLRCGICGRTMHTRIDRSKRKRLVKHYEGYEDRLLYRCKKHDPFGTVMCIGQELSAKTIDAWAWEQIQILAEHVEIIKQAIDLATSTGTLKADAQAIDISIATWKQKRANYLEDLEDVNLRADSRASIRQALNIANEQIEQLESERNQVLLGIIDCEKEREVYQEITQWCETVKDARGELTYQKKRDFLHLLGIVVVAKRKEMGGEIVCSMEVGLPKIKDLLSEKCTPLKPATLKNSVL